jgi:hypothetical protein
VCGLLYDITVEESSLCGSFIMKIERDCFSGLKVSSSVVILFHILIRKPFLYTKSEMFGKRKSSAQDSAALKGGKPELAKKLVS